MRNNRSVTPDRARNPARFSVELATMKVIWILGAGASAAAGYPLVSDFLTSAYLKRLDQCQELTGLNPSVSLNYESEQRLIATYGADLNAAMSSCIDSSDDSRRRRVNDFVVGIIDMVRRFHTDFWGLPHVTAFAQYVGASNSTVITFNYDTLLEEQLGFVHYSDLADRRRRGTALNSKEHAYTYGLPEGRYVNLFNWDGLVDVGSGYVRSQTDAVGTVPIVKLHGSMGWYYCGRCHILLYQPPSGGAVAELFFKSSVSGPHPCPQCATTTTFEMLFVPPAHDRRFLKTDLLDRLWERAEKELLEADVALIVGYSLPPDDKRARELLSRVSATNRKLTKVVVDPRASATLERRFRDVIGDCMVYRASFNQLMAYLCHARCGFEIIKRNIPLFHDMVSGNARRAAALGGSVPLGTNLCDELAESETIGGIMNYVPDLIGTAGTQDAVVTLAYATQCKSDAQLRALCVRALGNIGTQEALNSVLHFLSDFSEVPVPGDDPYEVSTYAVSGLRTLMFSAPELDYSVAAQGLAWLSKQRGASSFLRGMAARTLLFGINRGLVSGR
jgi:NAD-dependent SIR2 family protein deacetylase